MVSVAIPFIVVTVFWAVVGGIIPWVIPKGPNRGIIQVMIIMTAVCCYLFWLCTTLIQLNPLFGPELENKTVIILQQVWGN